MILEILNKVIQDFGPTGLLVIVIAFFLHKHFKTLAHTLKKINGELSQIIFIGRELVDIEKKRLINSIKGKD